MTTTAAAARRRELGGLVRQVRNQRGLTQQELAQRFSCSQGKIQKIEDGTSAVKLTDLDKIIDLLDIDDAMATKMATLAEQSGQNEPWSGPRRLVPKWFRRYLGLEAAASEIFAWHGSRLPGLLQSEPFMLALFSTRGMTDVTYYVRNRLARRKVLDRPDPPRCQFIVGEEALRRMAHGMGSRVAYNQVEHLLGLADTHPRVVVRVLLMTAPVPYLPPDYTILRFANDTKGVVFSEDLVGGDYREKPEEVVTFARSWDELRAAALDPPASLVFLRELRADLRKTLTF